MWVASLLRDHMVVRCAETGSCVYVVCATEWSIYVWSLDPMPESGASCVAFWMSLEAPLPP